MKDGNEPQDATTGAKPQNQRSESEGRIKNAQRNGHSANGGPDTPRGSEPETRAASYRRG
ncbi:MAG TPA: hypothetical protein VL100_11095 [Croceibacterium sp.]|nr:hypothetical protein [Croceibacterium sp.]